MNFIEIIEAYSHCKENYNKENSYHNWNHIEELLKEMSSRGIIDDISQKENILLTYSILFHDIIYDPKKNNNEELSAMHFKSYSKERLSLGEKDVNVVYEAILDTKWPHTGRSYIGQLLVDLDLCALCDEKRYKENGIKIEKEFEHLSEEEYIEGRTKWLTMMINKKFIYHTTFFTDGEDGRAFEILQNDLKEIRK